MRAATAYFAGVGTVVVAIAAGLGGGLLLGDIMSPQQPKHPGSEVTRLEQRSSSPPIAAMDGASQPVPYMGATQIPSTVAEPAASPPQAPQPQQAQPQARQASTQPAEPPKQPEQSTAPRPATSAAQPAAPSEQSAARERVAPQDSLAKAGDADLKREQRRAEDKRKWERRQQWTERRKWRQRDDDDLKDVEASVREDAERRSFFGRRESRSGRDGPRPLFSREPGPGRGLSLFDD